MINFKTVVVESAMSKSFEWQKDTGRALIASKHVPIYATNGSAKTSERFHCVTGLLW